MPIKRLLPAWRWTVWAKASVLPLLVFAVWPCAMQAQQPAGQKPAPISTQQEGFRTPEKTKSFTSAELLATFDAGDETNYTLGAGDELSIDVWDHPELSGKHIIGPDGKITISAAGSYAVAGLTREEASDLVKSAFSRFYRDLAVTLRVDKYTSHRVMILGRVTNPGTLYFETSPTLLEVITRAGGLPIGGTGAEKAALARCAIFRGRDKVVWIELKNVLNGSNLGLNIRLKRDDLVYLPDSDDQLVYVLGEVRTPGAYRLTPNMSVMDALALAGGPTKDASTNQMHVIRPSQNLEKEFKFSDLIKPGNKLNYSLSEGDVLYLPSRRLAKAGYVIDKINPFASLLLILNSLAK